MKARLVMLALPFWKMRKIHRNALGIIVIEKDTPIGMHIRKKRLKLQMNQEDAAKKLGVTEACVWLWENLQAKPQIHYMPAIIGFLGYCPIVLEGTSLKDRIKKYRIEHGLSGDAFGKLLGVTDSTVGEWGKGKTPKGENLARLEKVIG